MEALAHPRWEDFDYTYVNENPFGWFGNGWTENERRREINVDYLNAENIDFPAVPEKAITNGYHDIVRKEQPVTNGELVARL